MCYYDCVAPKKRYIKAFESTLPKQVDGDGICSRSKSVRTTGLHDLHGGTFLDVIAGRTIYQAMGLLSGAPDLAEALPYSYHHGLSAKLSYIRKKRTQMPIRIADRFHINRYVTDALQTTSE